MKVFSLNAISSICGYLQLSKYEISLLRESEAPMDHLKALLKDRNIIALLIKRTPTKLYTEMALEEKEVLDRLFKDPSLNWLKKKFALYSMDVVNDVEKLERMIRDNKMIFPEGLRTEVLASIKKYKAR